MHQILPRAPRIWQIINIIGTDLNGYVLDDAAIDYLEQTRLDSLDPNNILDAEGIKKITEITAREAVKANLIQRDKEKTVKQQDVEAKEAILVLEKQLAETEEKQKREIATIKSREEAETEKVAQEERLKSERARIATEEEVSVAEENKLRQIETNTNKCLCGFIVSEGSVILFKTSTVIAHLKL